MHSNGRAHTCFRWQVFLQPAVTEWIMPHKGRLFMHRGDYRGRLQLKKTQVLARQLYRSTKKNTGLWPGQTSDSSRDQHNLNVSFKIWFNYGTSKEKLAFQSSGKRNQSFFYPELSRLFYRFLNMGQKSAETEEQSKSTQPATGQKLPQKLQLRYQETHKERRAWIGVT